MEITFSWNSKPITFAIMYTVHCTALRHFAHIHKNHMVWQMIGVTLEKEHEPH